MSTGDGGENIALTLQNLLERGQYQWMIVGNDHTRPAILVGSHGGHLTTPCDNARPSNVAR